MGTPEICAEMAPAGTLPDMDVREFKRWALQWPPTWGNSLFWASIVIVGAIIPVVLLQPIIRQVEAHQPAPVVKVKTDKGIGPTGEPAKKPVEGF